MSNTKSSISPTKGFISLNINLREKEKNIKHEKADLVSAKLAPKKFKINPNSTYFESLSPIRNKRSSPSLRNLTIEEESHQNNDSAYQSSDLKKQNFRASNTSQLEKISVSSESSCHLGSELNNAQRSLPERKRVSSETK